MQARNILEILSLTASHYLPALFEHDIRTLSAVAESFTVAAYVIRLPTWDRTAHATPAQRRDRAVTYARVISLTSASAVLVSVLLYASHAFANR